MSCSNVKVNTYYVADESNFCQCINKLTCIKNLLILCTKALIIKMKQLDVDVSPPPFVRNHYLPVTLVTFDLDPVTFALLINV